MLTIIRKADDSGQDDDSASVISNDVDGVEEESEQIQYSILDRNLFGIRRRRTKVLEKLTHSHNIETARDALEGEQSKPSTRPVPYSCYETEQPKTRNKFKYAAIILVGITSCCLSLRYMPIYIVSFKSKFYYLNFYFLLILINYSI